MESLDDAALIEGLAGTFFGKQGSWFLMAGGSYFPEGKPWEKGVKHFSNRVFVFMQQQDGIFLLIYQGLDMPVALAEGAYASLPEGLLCVGDQTPDGITEKVWLLSFDGSTVNVKEYPPLPIPVKNSSVTLIGSNVYLVGGELANGSSSNQFLMLNLDKLNEGWQQLPDFPLHVSGSAVTYGLGHAQTFQQVYWLRALMGVSEALYLPTGLAMIADYHSSKTRSLAVGIHMSGLYAGQAFGGFGATIAANYSWHTVFHWFGLIGIVYAFILVFLLHDKEGHARIRRAKLKPEPQNKGVKKESVFSSLGVIFGTFSFWILLFYFMAPSFPGWATKNWLPTLFTENLGIEMAKAGPMATISIAIASFIGVMIGGPLSDRWVQKNIRGRIYTSVIGLSLTIPSLILLGFGHNYLGLIGAATLFGIGFGMFDTNNMPILCQIIPQRYRATSYGIMNMMGVFAGYAVTRILGSSTDAGNLGADFSKLSIIVFIAVVLMLVFVKPKHELTYPKEDKA
ncbi:MAG: MFS transporter [Fermentimonas sp.]